MEASSSTTMPPRVDREAADVSSVMPSMRWSLESQFQTADQGAQTPRLKFVVVRSYQWKRSITTAESAEGFWKLHHTHVDPYFLAVLYGDVIRKGLHVSEVLDQLTHDQIEHAIMHFHSQEHFADILRGILDVACGHQRMTKNQIRDAWQDFGQFMSMPTHMQRLYPSSCEGCEGVARVAPPLDLAAYLVSKERLPFFPSHYQALLAYGTLPCCLFHDRDDMDENAMTLFLQAKQFLQVLDPRVKYLGFELNDIKQDIDASIARSPPCFPAPPPQSQPSAFDPGQSSSSFIQPSVAFQPPAAYHGQPPVSHFSQPLVPYPGQFSALGQFPAPYPHQYEASSSFIQPPVPPYFTSPLRDISRGPSSPSSSLPFGTHSALFSPVDMTSLHHSQEPPYSQPPPSLQAAYVSPWVTNLQQTAYASVSHSQSSPAVVAMCQHFQGHGYSPHKDHTTVVYLQDRTHSTHQPSMAFMPAATTVLRSKLDVTAASCGASTYAATFETPAPAHHALMALAADPRHPVPAHAHHALTSMTDPYRGNTCAAAPAAHAHHALTSVTDPYRGRTCAAAPVQHPTVVTAAKLCEASPTGALSGASGNAAKLCEASPAAVLSGASVTAAKLCEASPTAALSGASVAAAKLCEASPTAALSGASGNAAKLCEASPAAALSGASFTAAALCDEAFTNTMLCDTSVTIAAPTTNIARCEIFIKSVLMCEAFIIMALRKALITAIVHASCLTLADVDAPHVMPAAATALCMAPAVATALRMTPAYYSTSPTKSDKLCISVPPPDPPWLSKDTLKSDGVSQDINPRPLSENWPPITKLCADRRFMWKAYMSVPSCSPLNHLELSINVPPPDPPWTSNITPKPTISNTRSTTFDILTAPPYLSCLSLLSVHAVPKDNTLKLGDALQLFHASLLLQPIVLIGTVPLHVLVSRPPTQVFTTASSLFGGSRGDGG